jgi:hypothetical protein
MFDSMSLSELFAAAEGIGAKYQSPEEREAFAREMATIAKDITAQTAKKTWAVLTSDRAVEFYKAVLTVLIVIVAIAFMGVWEGLKMGWVKVVKPGSAIVVNWMRDRIVQGWASFVAWLRQVWAEVEGFVVVMMNGAIGL